MRRVMIAVLAFAFAGVAGANLLTNPGFEISDGGLGGLNRTPSGWWAYENISSEGWAAQPSTGGTNGVAFYAWINGSYGGIGQDVTVTPANGGVYTFSINAMAEANYSSSASETWMYIELWNDFGDASYAYRYTNDIYSALTANAGNWATYTFAITNLDANITGAKPMFGAGNWTDTGGSQAAMWDNASFTQSQVIPEPTVAALLGIGGLLVCAVRRKIRG